MNIIELAKEAGLALTDHGHPEGYAVFCERLEAFAALVRSEALAEPVKQEPVAYVYDREIAGIGYRKDVAFIKNVEIGTDLYAAPVDVKAIRAEAYQQGRDDMKEEAAKVCEEGTALIQFQSTDCYSYAYNRAAAIRGLK